MQMSVISLPFFALVASVDAFGSFGKKPSTSASQKAPAGVSEENNILSSIYIMHI